MFQPVPEQQGPRDCHHSASDRTNDANDQQASTPEVSTSEKDKSPPNLLWIRGVINQACICPTWLHPTKGYSCIGMDDRHADDSPNSALCSQRFISGWFQGLLLSLANDSKLLVCKIGCVCYLLGMFFSCKIRIYKLACKCNCPGERIVLQRTVIHDSRWCCRSASDFSRPTCEQN